MKINKRVFICALLVLILLSCINTVSADETLNETLGNDYIDEAVAADVPYEELSVSGDTIGVDENGGGDYRTSSSAVSDTSGGETVFIKNEVYSENTLNTDGPLTETIPGLIHEGEPISLPEGTIYVSEIGDDENNGLSEDSAIATLSHAVDIVKARENKTATVYVLNGYYSTDAIDISDDVGVSLSIIGQEKGEVIIQGNGAYVFDVYGDNLVWNFKNLDFVDIDSTVRTSAALVLYSKNGNFTIDNCNFRSINSRLGAIAIGNDNGNTNVINSVIEDVTGSASNTAILTVNGDGKFILDNVEIRNCRLNPNIASSNDASYLRTLIYINTYEADLTISNSRITNNNGPALSLIETRSKLTIVNTTISNNVINTSLSGNNGGDNLIWANNDNSDVNIAQCVITNNNIVKSGKGLFYNQKGSINVEYCDISNNNVDSFVGASGTITANNNWWGTNDQPDAKVDNWVIMNVEVDDSDLSQNNEVTLTVDFNHVKTSSGTVEELTGGEIPKDSYSISVSAQNGAIAPASMTVQKGEVKSQTFTVTEVNDVITLTCDGDDVEVTIEGDAPYRGIIYVSKIGDDANEGSVDAPVATLAKAIELANDGIGQIIIDEGTYTGHDYQVTGDLSITGVGKVTLDANNQGGLFATGYPTNATKFILTNLTLAGANADFGQVINSYAGELVLDNVNITDNPGSGSLIIQSGKLTINNCIIANHNGGNVISDSSSAQIVINNTLFENNTVTDYAICYLSGYSGDLIIENTQFINNTGKLGIVKSNKKITVKDSKFIDNTNANSYGGAISDCDAFTITNSTFINNKAARDGGAISVGYNRIATITKSTFINNTANTVGGDNHGDAIYNYGKLTINYCVLLTNAENSLIYSESEYDANAQYNWWGTNRNPSSLNGVGTYEDDDYNDVECVIDSSNWVYMSVTTDLTENNVSAGDEVAITVEFTKYIDSTDALKPLSDSIPEVEVSARAINGALDEQTKTTSSNIAQFTYTAQSADEDTITITSANAAVPITVNGNEEEGSIIYVDATNGLDTNNGKTRQTAVKTIAHALEIASGQIVLLEGTHVTDYLGSIYEDLNITGEGRAIIDAQNNNRVLYVGSEANVVIRNVIMINGYSAEDSGALLGNANYLTLINCTLANSSAGQNHGGAIYSVGKLTLINTTIANCSAREGGAIWSNNALSTGNSIVLINSIFINNYASGNDNLGGGAIFAQQISGFTIENTSFIDNKAGTTSSGGAIFISHSTATVTITDSEFIGNHANGQDGTGGGAIYRTGTSNYQRDGNMIITGTLFENNTCDANGGAIYARSTTINVANSVLINNKDANDLAVYGYKTEQVSPAITLNDNWWGSNDSPKNLVGGYRNYKPTLNRWAILTVTNDSAIESGNTVKLTASINSYTTGTTNGTLSSPITVPRDVNIITTLGNINGVLENGEFSYNLTVGDGLKYLAVNVDNETVVLRLVSSYVRVEVGDITAKKYDKVNVVINVTSYENVDIGKVDLYAGDTFIDSIEVHNGKAIKDIVIPNDLGTYELIARFIDDSGLFEANESSATLTVDGICELWNSTFFNFFDADGLLRDVISEEELVFHGSFSDLGINAITISKPIAIIGDNVVISDMAFALARDDIKLTNMTLIANDVSFDENSGAIILVTGNDIELNNVLVDYSTPSNSNAFGILAISASDFKLLNSTIMFDSNNQADVTQHALQIRGCNDFIVEGNTINASLPARDVAYGTSESFFDDINQDLILAIGIQDGENGLLTENSINVVTKSASGDFPTIDSILVYGANNLEISWNNVTQVDSVNAGRASYSIAMDLYAFEDISVKYNNVIVNTTSGIEARGTAYPIQSNGPYIGLIIDHNNLTSISNGPALGIYSQNYDSADIVVTYNNISVVGFATEDIYSLVSGMEIQNTNAKIYNNTIYSKSVASYDDLNALYGISYAQYGLNGLIFDIRDNTVYTEGKYAIYLRDAKNSNVTGNYLIANELKGDSSVNVVGENNIVINNFPSAPVLSADDLVMTYKDGSTWVVTLTDGVNPIAGAAIKVGIYGKLYNRVTDADGVARLVVNLAPGSYAVNATFEGDNNYESAFVNGTVIVNKAVPVLTADDFVMSYKDGSGWVVTLTDANGTAIAGAAIKVGIYGKLYNRKTDDDGQACLVVNLAPGSYAVNATFAGNRYYESAFVNATVTVEKADVTLRGDDVVMSYKNGAYTVRVVDAQGNALANVVVKFTINNVNYKAKTDANGSASIAINLRPGTYPVSAVVNDAKYQSETVNNTVTVNADGLSIAASDVNMTYKDGTAYEVQLVNSDGDAVALSGQIIKITANGIVYNKKTDANGIAKLTINYMPGTYQLKAEYNGIEIANNVTVNNA